MCELLQVPCQGSVCSVDGFVRGVNVRVSVRYGIEYPINTGVTTRLLTNDVSVSMSMMFEHTNNTHVCHQGF